MTTTPTTTTTSTSRPPEKRTIPPITKGTQKSTKEGETVLVQKLDGAYIFPRPTLKTIESGSTGSPTPSSKLEQPYKLTLQSGDTDLPLVGFFQTPPSSPTESALMEMESGNFGAKIKSENYEEKKVEFRPFRNSPLRIVKGAARNKLNVTSEEKTTESNVFLT